MINKAIQSKSVTITNGNLEIPAYLAMPVDAGKAPGVVVLQEIFGVNSHIRDVTERLAKEGYVAIAPALFQRQAPNFEAGYTPQDIQVGKKYKEQTKAEELLGDIQAAINYLISQTAAKAGEIGCIGFCFGGHVAYLAATLPDFAAVASFYGAGIPTMTPGGDEPTIKRTKEINGGKTLYAFFGMEDASIPPEHIDKIEAALNKHQVLHRIFRYKGADHGFFCDQRASYNAAAATEAWSQVKQLFRQELY